MRSLTTSDEAPRGTYGLPSVVHRALSVYIGLGGGRPEIFAPEDLGLDRPGRYELRLHANERFVVGKSSVVSVAA